MPNTEKAIQQFSSYLKELENGAELERVKFIRSEAVTCSDLMNYSPLSCDFSVLDPIIHKVMTLTAKMIS